MAPSEFVGHTLAIFAHSFMAAERSSPCWPRGNVVVRDVEQVGKWGHG